MALLTLTSIPNEIENIFFKSLLTKDDIIFVSGNALTMCFKANPFKAKSLVRKKEIASIGGKPHSDWSIVSDQDWLDHVVAHKSIAW